MELFFFSLFLHLQNIRYTLIVALDELGNAIGKLYLDDFHSFNYQTSKAYCYREFIMSSSRTLISKDASGGDSSLFAPSNTMERIVIMGVEKKPISIKLSGERTLEFSYEEKTKTVTIRKPGMFVSMDWSIVFEKKKIKKNKKKKPTINMKHET